MSKQQHDEPTSPGDMIELSITEEVRTKSGSRWVKVGLTSAHRMDESTDDAVERIETFVVESVDSIRQQAMGG